MLPSTHELMATFYLTLIIISSLTKPLIQATIFFFATAKISLFYELCKTLKCFFEKIK